MASRHRSSGLSRPAIVPHDDAKSATLSLLFLATFRCCRHLSLDGSEGWTRYPKRPKSWKVVLFGQHIMGLFQQINTHNFDLVLSSLSHSLGWLGSPSQDSEVSALGIFPSLRIEIDIRATVFFFFLRKICPFKTLF